MFLSLLSQSSSLSSPSSSLSSQDITPSSETVDTQDEPRILQVEPASQGSLLVCRVFTAGLPGQEASLSMQSGLVASLDLLMALLDDSEQVLLDRRISFRLAFDLWEEVFSVEQQGQQKRFADAEQLAGFLSRLPGLPVTPLSGLASDGRFRLRVQLELHPIAPSERDRAGEVIAGERRADPAGVDDRQEVSVGLGQLIRFFYKDSSAETPPLSEAFSRWFSVKELRDAQD
jgi:hypothetical protein